MADITYYKKIFHPRIKFHPFRVYLWEFIFDFETTGLNNCFKKIIIMIKKGINWY